MNKATELEFLRWMYQIFLENDRDYVIELQQYFVEEKGKNIPNEYESIRLDLDDIVD